MGGKIVRKLTSRDQAQAMLTAEELASRLQRPMRYFPQVDSTQDLALTWLEESAPTGAVVIADEQLRGRGRNGHTWHTPPDVALALSVILKPRMEALPQVTMLGALAIAQMIEKLIPDEPDAIRIKWPNDVKLYGRKVSGILPEAAWRGERLMGVALGMGVNVRVDFAGTALEQTAISLEPALERRIDRLELIVSLLSILDEWSAWLGSDRLWQAWQSRLETIGQTVTVNNITGIAEKVDSDGALFIRDPFNQLHKIIAGDIRPSE